MLLLLGVAVVVALCVCLCFPLFFWRGWGSVTQGQTRSWRVRGTQAPMSPWSCLCRSPGSAPFLSPMFALAYFCRSPPILSDFVRCRVSCRFCPAFRGGAHGCQNRTKSDKIGQNRTTSDKIGQNRTKSDKIGKRKTKSAGPIFPLLILGGRPSPLPPNLIRNYRTRGEK